MPFAGFDGWDDCMATMTDEEGHDEQAAENICGALEQESEADNGNVDELRAALERGRGLIADVGVDLVSGVDVPAVDSKWVMMKSGGGRRGHDYRAITPVLMKADDSEKRIAYAAAMIPREPDKEGDVVGTATVEMAAHDFLKSEGGIDTDHSLIDGEGEPVESWVLKEERTFDLPGGGSETYPAGTWMLGIEWGAEAWDRIKSGELSGLSIYGMAEHVELNKAESLTECPHCAESLTGTNSETTDSGKSEAPDSNDMGDAPDDDPGGDGGGTDGGGADDGPTLKDVTEAIDAVQDSVSTLKEAVETEKQGAEEGAAMIGEDMDMNPGDVLDLVEAANGMDMEMVLDAISSVEAEESGNGDEEDDEVEMDAGPDDGADGTESTEKETDPEPNLAKGHTGDGVRAAQSEGRTGGGGSSGMPSYAEAAEQYEAGDS